MEHEATITIQWDAFIDQLSQTKDIDDSVLQNLEPGRELIERLMEQDLPFDYILNVTDSAFESAETILEGRDTAADVALQSLDETVWAELRAKFNRLPSRLDPTVEGEFI